MAEKENTRSRTERTRCVDDCEFAHLAKSSVPREVFRAWRNYVMASLGTIVTIAVAFAGWHIATMNALRLDVETTLKSQELATTAVLTEHELHVSERLTDARFSYNEDVKRFIRATMENRDILKGVHTEIGEVKEDIGRLSERLAGAEAKQDLVLEKVGLTN